MNYKKLLKKQKQKIDVKLGPTFFVNGAKKMMTMAPPINPFLFGFDQAMNMIKPHITVSQDNAIYSNLFASTLNSLIAEMLNYFQNRVHIKTGKQIKLTSVPSAKSQFEKSFDGLDIKTLIGAAGYKELKRLDEIRGNFQHSNDRYFIDFRVNGCEIRNVKELIAYCGKIKEIIVELDSKLEEKYPAYNVKKQKNGDQTIIEIKAIDHSFDIENMKINKSEPGK